MIILPYPVTSKRSHFQVLLAYDFEFSVGMLEYKQSIAWMERWFADTGALCHDPHDNSSRLK